jgi:hypothetical protein
MLGSITVAPNQWPTHAVIDWVNILRRVKDMPQREQRLAEASRSCARLSYQGTKLVFSTEQDDYWWWLMQNGDVNAARLLLAVHGRPGLEGRLGRLAAGFIGRQQGGAWHTTTANLWGGLALEVLGPFEATPVAGTTRASLGAASGSVDWARSSGQGRDARRAHQTTVRRPRGAGRLAQQHLFLPWPAEGARLRWRSARRAAASPGSRCSRWRPCRSRRRSTPATRSARPSRPGAGRQGPLQPRRCAARDAGGDGQRRHDLGGHHRPGAPAPPSWAAAWGAIRDRHPGRKAAGQGWPAFEERSFEAFRSYYEYLPKGTIKWSTRCA